MSTEILTEPSELQAAWTSQYEKIAQIFAKILGKKDGRIAEIGCGRGQLTVPLAKRATNAQFVLVDRFVGFVYSQNYKGLVSNLKRAKLIRRARIVVSDYLKWIRAQDNERYDAVISREFLPEIDSAETRYFIRESYRLLKLRGITVHSFLSPIPRNRRQELVIKADSDPVWTRAPPKEWFSPRPEIVIKELRKSGFQRIHRITVRSHLIMKGDAAKSWLKGGEVKDSFYEAHKKQLKTSGLEIPDWIIISGVKA